MSIESGKRIKVCIVLEGSYPFITGGVSAWVHELINGLSDIDFALFTISPEKNQTARYTLPKHVVEHKDIVLSEKTPSKKKPKNIKKMLKNIIDLHKQFNAKANPELSTLFEDMPKDFFLYSEATKNQMCWNMITAKNNANNPIYPFSDYFWAWKASHDMIFTIIGADLPDADIYHAVSTGYAGLACVTAKLKKKKPYLLTEHGLYHKEREMEIRRATFVRGYQRDMWVKIYNTLSRICYHYSDKIISLFEYNRKRQIEMGALENKAFVIPNGIDIKRFSDIKREKRKGFHVGIVARVVPIKDVKTFITTAKIISEQIPDIHFHCIGPTDEDPAYFKDCKLLVSNFHLENKFNFTGRQDVREYYSFLDVLLLTSIREAQPLVILEAYCAGLPVVSTKVGNVPELLDFDERLLASSKDSEKLAQGIKFIYENPAEVQRMIKKNKKKVHDFYGREMLYDKYREIYKELAVD